MASAAPPSSSCPIPSIGLERPGAGLAGAGVRAPGVRERLETDATYAVYLDRQQADIAAYRRDEGVVLPDELDFQGLPGLSNEIKAKLDRVRPRTLGQAARIEGITPAALTLLAGPCPQGAGQPTPASPRRGVTRSADDDRIGLDMFHVKHSRSSSCSSASFAAGRRSRTSSGRRP